MGEKHYMSADKRAAFKIAAIYLLFSGAWILFSDQILYFFVRSAVILTKF